MKYLINLLSETTHKKHKNTINQKQIMPLYMYNDYNNS